MTADGPRFEHDCRRCEFLGHVLGHDLYFHPSAPTEILAGSTVIARASSEPSDYQSGLKIARRSPIDEPLGMAYRLAMERGFIPETP